MANILDFWKTGAPQPELQDKKLIDRLYRKYRISSILAVTLGAGFAYTCRLGMSVVKKPLIDAGVFSAEQLGIIGSAIFYGYAAGKFFNGILADYANIKRFFATGVLISGLINLFMGWSPLLWVWIILWGVNGWFQGFNAPSGIVTLTHWYSNSERGRYYGIWSTAHGIGEGLTFVGIAAVVSAWGWRSGFWAAGFVGIFTAIGLYLALQDRPPTLGLPLIAKWRNDPITPVTGADGTEKKTRQAQISILKIPQVWLIGMSSALIYVTRYAINSWGVLYLQEAKGFSLLKAGSIIGVNTFAGIIGAVSFGFISDKIFHARRPPANLIFGIFELAALSIIFFTPHPSTKLLIAAFLIYGFSLSGLITSLGGLFAVDIAPKKAAGAVMGFVGIFSYVAAAIQEWISGTMIEHGTTMINETRHYDFHKVIIFWVGASVVSLILSTMLWRVRPKD
ncbi:MAG: MFS transporter [Calditrichaeota bacterium]|nr:MFS transporter [Calditrichota bacterium]